MKLFLTLASFVVFGAGFLAANPLVLNENRRPIRMTAEKVVIDVRVGSSEVKGSYTFEQEEDEYSAVKDDHITIHVPVLILDRKSDEGWPEPIIRIGKKVFKAESRNDIGTTGGPDLREVKLPKGWSMTTLEAEIPLRLVKKKFEVEISYRQQNLKRDIAGYVPIKPPQEHEASVIVFRAGPGCVLKPVKKRWFGKRVEAQSSMKFKPQDKQLVSVRCVRER